MAFSSPPSTAHLPRVLCLHGGGVSSEIFFYQSRTLIAELKDHFRLVFADGPFFCDMHPDLVPVYGGMGTCYRWSPWLQGQGEMDNDTAAAEIEYAMKTAMKTDDTNGGKGEWVGLLGFSQGANISISVLFENELRKEESKEKGTIFYPFAGGDWKFGVILAGRGPPKCLGELTKGNKYFQGAGDVAHEHLDTLDSPYRLKAPTVHLHGLRDPGLEQHRELYRDYCTTNNAVLLEWDEAHRVPFRPIDVKRVVEETLKIAKSVKAI